MTGKAYYITTLGDWQRHASRFANSHFIVLAPPAVSSVGAQHAVPGEDACLDAGHLPVLALTQVVIPSEPALAGDEGSAFPPAPSGGEMRKQIPRTKPLRRPRNDNAGEATAEAEARILVLIEADEGVHLSLEDEPAFEPLPHPLAQKPISESAQAALAPHGVSPGATTFDAAETLARIHPLLRHRVF